MRLYLDDDSIAVVLVRLLRQAGHDLLLPSEAGLSGDSDAVHFEHAIREQRVLLSKNHDDFEDLHRLVMTSTGHHPGILIIRQDNDPARDMTPRGVAAAIDRFERSGIPPEDNFYVLNHWR